MVLEWTSTIHLRRRGFVTRVQTDEEEDLLEIEESLELDESPEETLGFREAGLVPALGAPRKDLWAFFVWVLLSSAAA